MGLAGLGKLLVTGNVNASLDVIQNIQQTYGWKLSSAGQQSITTAVQNFTPIQYFNNFKQSAGNYVEPYEPEAATLAYMAPDATLALVMAGMTRAAGSWDSVVLEDVPYSALLGTQGDENAVGLISSQPVGNVDGMTVEGTASYHQTTSLWTPNPSGARTMAEARAIAENNGAYIADDVHFIPVEDSLYDSKFGNSYATYGRFTVSDPNASLMWQASSTTGSGIADSTGRINVWIRQSVLDSDQAITALLGHETYEVEALRPVFQQNGGGLPASTYSNLVRPGVPNNIHWQAVDFGDQLVRDMLGLGD